MVFRHTILSGDEFRIENNQSKNNIVADGVRTPNSLLEERFLIG